MNVKRRIVIADDHSIFREGLRSMLEREPGLEVVGEAGDGAKAVSLSEELKPDIVIMDLSMQGLDGFEATERIKQNSLKIKVVVLSMHSHKALVKRSFKAGASAFLVKEDAFNELSRAIEIVGLGKEYLSSSLRQINEKVFSNNKNIEVQTEPTEDLSEREMEILKYICEGWPNKAMAAHLNLSVKTIEAHRSKVMRKLKLYSAAELTRYAIREGLISP